MRFPCSVVYARVALGSALCIGLCGVAHAQTTTKPPGYYYWDGSIIRAPDGIYHFGAPELGAPAP